MDIKPITSDADYHDTMKRINELKIRMHDKLTSDNTNTEVSILLALTKTYESSMMLGAKDSDRSSSKKSARLTPAIVRQVAIESEDSREDNENPMVAFDSPAPGITPIVVRNIEAASIGHRADRGTGVSEGNVNLETNGQEKVSPIDEPPPHKSIDETANDILEKLHEISEDVSSIPFTIKSSIKHEFSVLTDDESDSNTDLPPDLPEEVKRIVHLETFSKSQLAYIYRIPWNKNRTPAVDFQHAKFQLEESHFGMLDVKESILRYIACQMRIGSSYGAVLMLVGPPGVGKTSVAKAIAESMKRNFVKISLAGMSTAFSLKGSERTYKDAKPGLIIDALIRADSLCPLLLLDEVDKVGKSQEHGDPAHVLLDILDSNRSRFTDSLIGIPVDLSNVIFVLTANDHSMINPILLDRLELVFLRGYTVEEKVEIALKYVIPKLNKEFKFSEEDEPIEFTKDALEEIVSLYTNDSGIRSLERILRKIFEIIVAKISLSVAYERTVDTKDIDKILEFRYQASTISDSDARRVKRKKKKSRKINIPLKPGLFTSPAWAVVKTGVIP